MATISDYTAGFAEDPGYLDYARVAPLSPVAEAEARAGIEVLRRARFGTLDSGAAEHDRLVAAVSRVTGFDERGVVFQPNTSMGLMHALFGLSGEVLLAASEFPSMTYAAVRARQARGLLTPRWLQTDHGRVTPGQVREQLMDATTAVAVSLVDYRTGYVVDIDGIRQVIGDRLLIVDAAQGLGVVDADLAAADVVAAPGYKWLRAGQGNGFLALNERALASIEPVMSGFTGVAGESFDTIADPVHAAAAFSVSHPDFVAEARLAAALEEAADVGVATIGAAVADKVDQVLELVDEFGLPVVSPRNREERAGIVVLQPEPSELTALSAALVNHGVTVTLRGGAARISAHAGTSADTLDVLHSALAAYANSR